jgi:hypothetical protein
LGAQASHRLWIDSREHVKKFLRFILPHIPVFEMLYKSTLLFHDPELQQRWISEMESLSIFSKQEIEKLVVARKARLSAFCAKNPNQRMI